VRTDGQTCVMKLIVAFGNLRKPIKPESVEALLLLFKRGCQLCCCATENIPSSGAQSVVLIYCLIPIHDVRMLQCAMYMYYSISPLPYISVICNTRVSTLRCVVVSLCWFIRPYVVPRRPCLSVTYLRPML